ncbi:MAG: response regulator [Deltaproteobacteria bacterium]|nr:response regulator [Deltaproteobacteria bacterium]
MDQFKILLVDDEEELVKTLAERIKLRNLDPQVAFNGEQALLIFEHSIPDVMVLDLKMPGIDGMEVLRRVKKVHPEVQVIILTGHGSDRDADEARRLGAFDYMQKPVDLEDLVRSMRGAYRKKRDLTSGYGEF